VIVRKILDFSLGISYLEMFNISKTYRREKVDHHFDCAVYGERCEGTNKAALFCLPSSRNIVYNPGADR
jgi:hypothetical protein